MFDKKLAIVFTILILLCGCDLENNDNRGHTLEASFGFGDCNYTSSLEIMKLRDFDGTLDKSINSFHNIANGQIVTVEGLETGIYGIRTNLPAPFKSYRKIMSFLVDGDTSIKNVSPTAISDRFDLWQGQTREIGPNQGRSYIANRIESSFNSFRRLPIADCIDNMYLQISARDQTGKIPIDLYVDNEFYKSSEIDLTQRDGSGFIDITDLALDFLNQNMEIGSLSFVNRSEKTFTHNIRASYFVVLGKDIELHELGYW